MGKHCSQSDRSQLPPGWRWADWDGAKDEQAKWKQLDVKTRQRLKASCQQFEAGVKCGRMVHHRIAYMTSGIGKAKAHKPNPGHRLCFFQDGSVYFVTHLFPKDNDHAEQMEFARRVKTIHLARKRQRETGDRTNRHKEY